MDQAKFIFVTGCNAAGKSSFIRTRFNNLSDYEIIMTDVFKTRAKEVCEEALNANRNVILETPFNVESFKELIDLARHQGYYTSLIVLFLDNPQHSIERVANRVLEQNGLYISGDNIKWNFSESFKNVANYFLYFDRSDFIYTGIADENTPIMSFRKGEIASYKQNHLDYPQRFAHFSHNWHRLDEYAHNIIKANLDFENSQLIRDERPNQGYRFRY
jgi:predicted ABC-type ATPase